MVPFVNFTMLIDFANLSPSQAYFAMIQAIIPRPIAWVLSDNGPARPGAAITAGTNAGPYNLAPFSFFNGVSGEPPMLMISVGRKPDGAKKDTWVNIEERGDFVVHIPPRDLAAKMVATSATLPHGESEVTRAGLTTAPVDGWRLPRIVGPRVAIGCVRHVIIEVGAPGENETQGLILGRVKGIWVDDAAGALADGKITINAASVDPVARLGGAEYVLFGEKMTIPRPA